jgi:ribonuclease D
MTITPQPQLDRPLIIDTPASLKRLEQALKGKSRLAIDTEANSLYAYQAQVCLIQISTDEQDYLVDPLPLDSSDFDFLGAICADPSVEKVFHAAEYDVMILRRDLGFDFTHIFDTMIAARVLGWEQFGLGSILEDRYGVKVNKKHQRANWGRRPLADALIRYAQMDTHYLLSLRDELYQSLLQGDHLEEAQEMFDEVCQSIWNGPDFDPEGYWRIHRARDLDPRALAVLRELYLYREQQAEDRDLPVFKIMGDQTLIELAQIQPDSLMEARHTAGISEIQARRYGSGILDAIRRGQTADTPSRPRRNGRQADDETVRRYDALHLWRKECALKRGVSSEVITTKDALWELAKKAPRSMSDLQSLEYLGPWRIKTYGQEILRVIAEQEHE